MSSRTTTASGTGILGHATQATASGSAVPLRLRDTRIPQRIWDKIVTDDDDCWIWKGTYASAPQTRWKIDGKQKTVNVRRVFYLVAHGGPPPFDSFGGCKSHCVNPTHIRNANNADLCREVAAAKRAKKTHCPNGHERAVVGIFTYTRERRGNQQSYEVCRACHRERMKAMVDKKRRRKVARMSPARRRKWKNRSEAMRRIWNSGKRRNDVVFGRRVERQEGSDAGVSR